ncbi:hypothetical protein L198_04948 [Cryptococcus wingfieldii CBS 7118]|uniref:Uncharacterized protein n=1 Tax=Cryptococcus wingfieldii CBS 7118 TaxID=1295528 RepID=A0A1E3J1U7_9TREE|nr:hypothetical protein L198_04948 [Cryptococcus wingfieldii CBS 7118]ODN94802.1 hypothetical protein L198_04948 [Cryptococcus wingfieldii CBS 7118]
MPARPPDSFLRFYLGTRTNEELRTVLNDAGCGPTDQNDKAGLVSLIMDNPYVPLPESWDVDFAGIVADIRRTEAPATTTETPATTPSPYPPPPPPLTSLDHSMAQLQQMMRDLTTKVDQQREYIDQQLREPLPTMATSSVPEPVPEPVSGSSTFGSSLPPAVHVSPPSAVPSSAPPALTNRSPSTPLRGAVPSPKVDARSEWAYIPPSVFDSVVDGSFEIRDLWKLDPTRRLEIDKMGKAVTSDRALNGLAELLQSTSAFAEQSRSATKYRSMDDIILPWSVFCRIRDVAQPGSGHYLSAHVTQLYLASFALRKNFHAVLRYHLDVCQKRLSLGDAVVWDDWCSLDNVVLNTSLVQSFASSSSTSGVPRLPSVSSPSASRPRSFCRNWNQGTKCRFDPCSWPHICSSCLAPGHRGPACPSALRAAGGPAKDIAFYSFSFACSP